MRVGKIWLRTARSRSAGGGAPRSAGPLSVAVGTSELCPEKPRVSFASAVPAGTLATKPGDRIEVLSFPSTASTPVPGEAILKDLLKRGYRGTGTGTEALFDYGDHKRSILGSSAPSRCSSRRVLEWTALDTARCRLRFAPAARTLCARSSRRARRSI